VVETWLSIDIPPEIWTLLDPSEMPTQDPVKMQLIVPTPEMVRDDATTLRVNKSASVKGWARANEGTDVVTVSAAAWAKAAPLAKNHTLFAHLSVTDGNAKILLGIPRPTLADVIIAGSSGNQ
jgi:hypothetical protein